MSGMQAVGEGSGWGRVERDDFGRRRRGDDRLRCGADPATHWSGLFELAFIVPKSDFGREGGSVESEGWNEHYRPISNV